MQLQGRLRGGSRQPAVERDAPDHHVRRTRRLLRSYAPAPCTGHPFPLSPGGRRRATVILNQACLLADVPPPTGVPAPGDGEKSYPDAGFGFDRLGVRIPTVLISPWIPAGTVVSAPPEAREWRRLGSGRFPAPLPSSALPPSSRPHAGAAAACREAGGQQRVRPDEHHGHRPQASRHHRPGPADGARRLGRHL